MHCMRDRTLISNVLKHNIHFNGESRGVLRAPYMVTLNLGIFK